MSGFSSTSCRLALSVALMLPVGALSSCGGAGTPANGGGEGQAGRAEEPTPAPAGAPGPTDDGAETTVAATGVERTETGDGGEIAVMCDGVRPVGDAGEVEFGLEDGRLTLGEARPNEGWDARVGDEADDDDMEVDIVRRNVEWQFRAALDDEIDVYVS